MRKVHHVLMVNGIIGGVGGTHGNNSIHSQIISGGGHKEEDYNMMIEI